MSCNCTCGVSANQSCICATLEVKRVQVTASIAVPKTQVNANIAIGQRGEKGADGADGAILEQETINLLQQNKTELITNDW